MGEGQPAAQGPGNQLVFPWDLVGFCPREQGSGGCDPINLWDCHLHFWTVPELLIWCLSSALGSCLQRCTNLFMCPGLYQ